MKNKQFSKHSTIRNLVCHCFRIQRETRCVCIKILQMATLTGTIHGVTEVNQQKHYLVAPLATSTASLAEKEVLLWWRNSSTAVRMSMSRPLAFQLWQLHLLYLHLLTVQAWYYLQRERQNFEDYATSCIFFFKKNRDSSVGLFPNN